MNRIKDKPLPFMIGPNPVVAAGFPLIGFLVLFGLGNLMFLHLSFIRVGIYDFLESIRMGSIVVDYYNFNQDIYGSFISLFCLLCGLAMGYFAIKTSSYEVRDSGGEMILSLRYGMFVKGGPGDSFFKISSDTRLIAMIADCDCSRNFFDLLFGTGTLYIKSANEGDVRVPFVGNPQEVVDFLMSHSKVPDSRIYSSV